jgi:hypothetical protein
MSYKDLLSLVGVALTLIAFVPYIFGILQGKVKPHVFSWVTWGITTFVVFLAQLKANGGAGAWVIGISGSITILIAVLAFIKRADLAITKVDWVFFLSALSSLPLWYFTSDPFWAVFILTIVDILGFGPTLRKSYSDPHSESLTFLGLFLVRNILVIFALESYSATTVLFPALVAFACGTVMSVIALRRRTIDPSLSTTNSFNEGGA